ncbi:MAG: 2-deoxyribose-5-phosphate aldolase, partial [Thaumarchaeota archaeon]|nr:2-deoxyribose-5-phosphate aldolase [Nitrososphaerota archaeon]
TGTGLGKGATPREVRIIRDAVEKDFGIKAAGGIRTLAQVLELIEAGATRIGTSSVPGIISEIKS